MNKDISEIIGQPALLEQLAEECNELAQCALKLARKMRGDNPTPKTEAEIKENLQEEIADVQLCISMIMSDGLFDSNEMISVAQWKLARWYVRLEEAGKEIRK